MFGYTIHIYEGAPSRAISKGAARSRPVQTEMTAPLTLTLLSLPPVANLKDWPAPYAVTAAPTGGGADPGWSLCPATRGEMSFFSCDCGNGWKSQA